MIPDGSQCSHLICIRVWTCSLEQGVHIFDHFATITNPCPRKLFTLCSLQRASIVLAGTLYAVRKKKSVCLCRSNIIYTDKIMNLTVYRRDTPKLTCCKTNFFRCILPPPPFSGPIQCRMIRLFILADIIRF